MYNKRDENRKGGQYERRPPYDPRPNRPAPLPEGFALYYIGTLCPGAINEKVGAYKQYMQTAYGCRAAQKSPAHLTLVPPFKAEEDLEPLLQEFVTAYNTGIIPFEIQLRNFDHFNKRVLFVDVVPNEELTLLEKNVNLQFSEAFPSIIFRTKPEFHPHVTIATRDIPEHKFDEIWDYFQQQSMDASFTCNSLTVLKLEKGVWEVK